MRARSMASVLVLVLVAAGLAISACVTSGQRGGDIVGRWEAKSLAEGAKPVSGSFIEFGGDATCNGFAGVNTFAGQYTANAASGEIRIGPLASTRMSGPPALMVGEQALMTAFDAARSYRVQDSTLTLYDANHGVIAQLAPAHVPALTDCTWVCTGVNNGKGALMGAIASPSITAQFTQAGVMKGLTGCGTYTAPYKTTAESGIAIAAVTSIETSPCPIAARDQRRWYLAAIRKAATYRIDVKAAAEGAAYTLTLRDGTGAMMATYTSSK